MLNRTLTSFVSLVTCSVLSLIVLVKPVVAKDWVVKTPDAFKSALKQVEAGDSIVLANGTWNNFEIKFKAKGTKDAPITLRAETNGQVILQGQSNLRMSGEYLVVKGLVFKNGYTPTSEVISFRTSKTDFAYHSRVTEVVIDNYSNPDKFESDYWVGIYGQQNRFDHNYLVGKRNKGVTLAVRLNSAQSQENHHRIDHNYFGPRPVLGSNGGETLRIGTSHHSLSSSFTVVEDNYFDRCNGEVEIISVKSGNNVIRNNVFNESRGTLTLRHGNGNRVEGNVFFGNGVDHTGGIRIINRDQVVQNNYLEGLTGYRFGSGFTVMNGVPDSPINRYHQVVNAQIKHNSFINVEHIQFAAGSDAERSATPQNSVMTGNLLVTKNGLNPFSVFDDISGISFSDNVMTPTHQTDVAHGIDYQTIDLKRASNGLLYPADKALLKFGVSKNLHPIEIQKTGPTWYAKVEPDVAFDSGKVVFISATESSLENAVAQAKDGDVIELGDGVYNVNKILKLNKTLSFRAKNRQQAKVLFDRSTLFEIANGGSLKIDGLVLDGKDSSDSAGNVLIRTSKWGMITTYRFEMINSLVQNLDVNHSYHFFDSGSRAFAFAIDFHNNQFKAITGDILRLNKETDDLGIYNAEYIRLTGNHFEHVKGALADVYRGGTDESTFGPHFIFENNQVRDAGLGKRNKLKASIRLHGNQVANISHNLFKDSAKVMLEHTVGEPQSLIRGNEFNGTPKPEIVELRVAGPHTAKLMNNRVL
ncbi:polysaccharide lyase 6 family protein [Echinimonas agarilytica]|uniref:Polysaccharide lyase 6 family protein n=1 Tax=Echinimonas agarilytica TaxID=1215918 RepID=A0AA41W4F0_9GAMM|nr:polysaccharide lyase 6 family protein [Echinimonas agarilytica]MCM2678561.1 polysaccharide lyase 6 family protein [Echinimonas agarilytica]